MRRIPHLPRKDLVFAWIYVLQGESAVLVGGDVFVVLQLILARLVLRNQDYGCTARRLLLFIQHRTFAAAGVGTQQDFNRSRRPSVQIQSRGTSSSPADCLNIETLKLSTLLPVTSIFCGAVSLTISPGMDLTGRIRFDGQAAVSFADIRVTLRTLDPGGMTFGPVPDSRVKEDGSFSLSNVIPDRYKALPVGGPARENHIWNRNRGTFPRGRHTMNGSGRR
jgi:hypothetical protein